MREDAFSARWMAVGEHDDRRAIEVRAGDAVHDRRGTRAERRQARAGTARDFRLRHRRQRAGGLGGREDERQDRAAGGVDEIEIAAAARHPEDARDAGVAQPAHDEIGDRRHRTIIVLRV